jgi:hypothetical protein
LTTHAVPFLFLRTAPQCLTANALVGQWGVLRYHVSQRHTMAVKPFLKGAQTVEDIALVAAARFPVHRGRK